MPKLRPYGTVELALIDQCRFAMGIAPTSENTIGVGQAPMDFEFNVPGATRLFPSFDDRNHGHTPLVLPSAMSEALERLVLPVGIEPTTSPLPRECSTTELRQRPRATGTQYTRSRRLARHAG